MILLRFISYRRQNGMIHDILIFLAFIGILLAPAIVAANSDDLSDEDN
jgi:hypothetical protein